MKKHSQRETKRIIQKISERTEWDLKKWESEDPEGLEVMKYAKPSIYKSIKQTNQ